MTRQHNAHYGLFSVQTLRPEYLKEMKIITVKTTDPWLAKDVLNTTMQALGYLHNDITINTT